MDKTYLGLDIGTTKVAAAIYSLSAGKPIAVASIAAKADLPSKVEGGHEQDPNEIFDKLLGLVRKLPAKAREGVSAIGVAGQMHGVLLMTEDGGLSPLMTWKDRRASVDGSFRDIFAKPGCAGLRDGFGFTTLAWMAAHKALDGRWSAAATVQDAFVAQLCGLRHPLCDHADAASWGLFDLFKGVWDMDAIDALGIPRRLLPELAAPGAKAGTLCGEWAKLLGLAEGLPVAVATGDNQASALATSEEPDKELYLSVGTGAQLSVALKPEDVSGKPLTPGMELRPFFDGRLLAVVAPLCGGESFAWLANAVKRTFTDFGMDAPSESELYRRIDELAMRSLDSGLEFKPNFIGERHAPLQRASIEGIGLENFDTGSLAAALAAGIMSNMKSMMAPWALEGRGRIMGSGNALRRLSIMKVQARKVYGLPLTVSDMREEAACGAAKLASRI